MGEYHRELSSHALHSPPPSPTSKHSPRQKINSSNHVSVSPTIITPTPHGEKRKTRSGSGSDTSQYQPPTNRQRTDKADYGKKLELDDGGSSSASSSLTLDGLMVNMERMAKMLRRADLMSDPVLACLVSAQTVMMACTVDLMSRRAAPALDHHNNSPSPNKSLNGAAHNNNK